MSKDIPGCPCMSMDVHGYPWIYLWVNLVSVWGPGRPWMFMDVSISQVGVSLGSVCVRFGVSLLQVWGKFGISLGLVWDRLGISLGLV